MTGGRGSTIHKSLRGLDRTDGSRHGHYGWRDVAAAMHASGGSGHD